MVKRRFKRKSRQSWNKFLIFGTLTAVIITIFILIKFGPNFYYKPFTNNKNAAISKESVNQPAPIENVNKTPKTDEVKTKAEAESFEIVVGCVADLSAGIKAVHEPLLEGIQLRINAANQTKELGNKHIKLIYLDHQYEPHIAIKQLNQLVSEYKTKILLKPMGTEILKAALPTIRENNMLVLFPTSTSNLFLNEKNVFFSKASFEDEAIALTKHALKIAPNKKYVFFYQDDDYGLESLNAGMKVLSQNNFDLKNILTIGLKRNSTDSQKQANEIKKFSPDCIFLFCAINAALSLFSNLGTDFFNVTDKASSKLVFSLSPMDSEEFREILRNKNLTIIQTHIVPNIAKKDLKIIVDYIQNAEKNNKHPRPLALEGYIAADIFVEILQKIDGPITNEKIVKELENLNNSPLKGLKLTWNPEKRSVFSDFWLEDEKGNWELIKAEKPQELKPDTSANINQYSIGSLLGITGSAIQEKRVAGLNLRINKAIKNNEIKGVKLNLNFVDHQYEPAVARQKLIELLDKNKINAILNFSGTSNLKLCMDIINKNNLLVLSPITSFTPFKDEKNVIFSNPSFEDEGVALAKYAVKTLFTTKLAIFYQDDDYGKSCLEAIKNYLKSINFPDANLIATSHQRNNLDVSKSAEEFKKFQPDCLISISVPLAIIELINKIDLINSLKYLMCVSLFNTIGFEQFTKSKGFKVIKTHLVPNLKDDNVEIVKAFKNDIKEAGHSIDEYSDDESFRSYIDASILIELLKKITPPITNEKIIEKISEFKNYSLKGIDLNYDSTKRCLSKDLWIESETGEWIYTPVDNAKEIKPT